jgi:hypothetical protein
MNDPVPTPPRRRGCLFYGCLSGVILTVALLVAALIGIHILRKAFLDYTDTAPMAMPATGLTPAQAAEIQQRCHKFLDDLSAGKTVEPLALAGNEIDALLTSTNAAQNPLSEHARLSVEGDHLKGDVSFPIRGRYLNGSGTFAVSLQNGVLNLNVQTLTVKGKPLPASFMNGLRMQNFASGMQNDTNLAAIVSRLQTIQVKDGKLLLVPKPSQDSSAAPKGEAEKKD